MTIDESIEHSREKAKEQRYYANFERNGMMYQSCIKCAEEQEQLAEWLEELKAYREQHQALCDAYDVNTVEDIYDKAIDDVIKAADKLCGYYTGECKNLTRDDLLKIEEDLKNT